MANKFEKLTQMYADISKLVVSSPDFWKGFLRSACHNYKLRFDEQLMIYAQRPDATAVLEIEKWNSVFGRWVNRGTKGIAVFEKRTGNDQKYKHYFDISDTHPSRVSRPVPIWEMKPEYTDSVIETLENTYGELENKDTLAAAVISAAKIAVEDNISDYADGLLNILENTENIEDAKYQQILSSYPQLVCDSLSYMMMSRLGIDADKNISDEQFKIIEHFNASKLFNLLGTSIKDFAVIGLSEISKTILALDREREKINNSIEHRDKGGKVNDEALNRDRVHAAGRLSSAERGTARTAGGRAEYVGQDEERLLGKTSHLGIHRSSDELHSDGALEGRAGESRGDGGQADRADEEAGGHHGAAQSGRHDGMGTQDEQPAEQSSGDRAGGDHFRSLSRNYYDRRTEDKSLPFFGNTNTINEMLITTPHLKASKDEIRQFFEAHQDDAQKEEYIKGIFNDDYTELILKDGRRVGYKTYQNVLHLWEGSYLSRTKQSYYDWGVISKHFEGLRLLGELKEQAKPLPSMDGQRELIEAGEKTSAFSFSQEIIDKILTRGSGVSEGKMRIYEQFEKSLSASENVDFLKHEYGWGGSYPAIIGADINESHDGKGIELTRGLLSETQDKIRLSWKDVEKRIKELIRLDRYLNPKEKENYPKWLEKQEIRRAEAAAERRNREILAQAPPLPEQSKEYTYEYHLGDKVHIGADEFEILSIGDNVMLYDTRFPLYQTEIPYAEFDEKVRENPLNEHLRIEVEAVSDTESKIFDASVRENAWQEYKQIKTDNTDSIILYQTGDFFEIMGEDARTTAKTLGLNVTARRISENESVDLCGFPAMRLEENAEQLRDAGLRITIAAWLNGERRIYPFVDVQKNIEKSTENEKEPLKEKADAAYAQKFDGIAFEKHLPDHMRFKAYEDIGDGEVYWVTLGIFTVEDLQKLQQVIRENGDDIKKFYITSRSISPSSSFEYDKANNLLATVTADNIDKDDYINAIEEAELEEYLLTSNDEERAANEAPQEIVSEQKQSDTFSIYQLKHIDETRDLRFEPYDRLIATGHKVDPAYYEQVYTASLSSDMTLDGIYTKFNIDRPADFTGHSLSVSDVIVLQQNGQKSVHYVDSFGFKEIPEFFKEQPEQLKEEKSEEVIVPQWEQPKKSKAQAFDLYPHIPMSERHNFNLAENEVEVVSKGERFRRNIEAIRVLKQCRSEERYATPDEQIILSKYVGWGGLADCFDERHSHYAELKNRLTPEEYASARESTLTAFYTPETVIKAVYKALQNMGFKEGNILEPSCGVGNFMGMLPESMKNAKIYGVELDTISAGIAQQLYQKNSIAAQGYEEAALPDSFFDAAVGNVPFGDFKLNDKRYNKHNFLIHDYFFAKTLDKLRPGGVMAFITSKGTLDKENPAVRKYIAERAELLGAIRLPNNTFKGNAGTAVVSDIIFLQKRDRITAIEPDWVHLNTDENGIKLNQYFVDHPEMILGEMKMVSGRFGMEATCEAFAGADLAEQLEQAITHIKGDIKSYEAAEDEIAQDNSIPADPTVRNFSYTLVDDTIYYRENSMMKPVETTETGSKRIKGMIGIRESVRRLIELQTEGSSDAEIKAEQAQLNKLYDSYTEKYGLLSSRANKSAFNNDSSFSLLTALEVVNEDGVLERKADMFYKRTIKPPTDITSVDTASEALSVSMGKRACVDIEYMQQLSGKTEDELYSELKGAIFLNPRHSDMLGEPKYLPADEYLSGNVREKLAVAKKMQDAWGDEYAVNVAALEKVQPQDLTAGEIEVRLGATWLPKKYVQEFMYELLHTPYYLREHIIVNYSPYNCEWNIENKSSDRANLNAYSKYGTNRINAYRIIEETLNLKDVRIFDYVEDEYGNSKAVLNAKETAIARSKQQLIKDAFKEWIWKDAERRETLCRMYNEKFNSIRPREYDGSYLEFSGINPEINLREHQRNAIAHVIYGGNTLLAHAVGAGKTFEMAAAAMESKRLGLCNKSLFVVPNHLTEQWASEFLQLYPSANILVATKKDFETKNRKRFCGRIATGDYDAVIIGHSQFEKIPMSVERQRRMLEDEIAEVTAGIKDLKRNNGDYFSIKQLERTRKSVKAKLDKLNDQSRKDDVVTFEELGIDRIFVDESHYYKNLYLFTKMRNVGGIAQTEAQKSADLYMKCRYLDELTGGRGTVFATGTPISNSMVELYTIQRYLQYNTLKKNNLQNFDAWASTFGETVTAMELTPEGTSYREKTRFARFYNLPELMAMFKEVADIKTADMLNLPVPKVNYHNISVKPSPEQKAMVAALGKRADKVRKGMVDSREDNMLKITNDGRKLALDQRLINPLLPDFEGSKLNACVDFMYDKWEAGKEERLTQLFFCDLSTPKGDGSFSVYEDIREKLIKRGVPKEEIRFIHEANTETQKQELFKKVRKGDVRILMGSTQKMGAGTNVQDKLKASSDLDCPWRPSDLEQRLGRIQRQGNENLEVDVARFVTEGTFDAYLYQMVENKQKFVSQIMTSKSPVRVCDDIDEASLNYAEIKMLATGNPYIKEKMDLEIQVQRLKLLKSNYLSEKYAMEDKLIKFYPKKIQETELLIAAYAKDLETAKQHPKQTGDNFCGIEIDGKTYTEKADAGQALINRCKKMQTPDPVYIGEYRGFKLALGFDAVSREYIVRLKGAASHDFPLGGDAIGNITRLDNRIDKISERMEHQQQKLTEYMAQMEVAKTEVQKPFEKDTELNADIERLNELNVLIKEIDEQADKDMQQEQPVPDMETEDIYEEDYEEEYDEEPEL